MDNILFSAVFRSTKQIMPTGFFFFHVRIEKVSISKYIKFQDDKTKPDIFK